MSREPFDAVVEILPGPAHEKFVLVPPFSLLLQVHTKLCRGLTDGSITFALMHASPAASTQYRHVGTRELMVKPVSLGG